MIINPLSNDTDANGDTLSLASFEAPTSGGTVTKSGNSLTFVSDGSTGTITFKYLVYDGKVNSLTPGIITINVNAAADPAPVVGGAFAALADMEISDQA